MTPKQQRFVQEYLVDLNATQAAIRAGYSEPSAYAIGVENLRKPQIQALIKEAQQERAVRSGLTQDYVLARLQVEAEFSDKGSSPGARVKALELIGKHLGMFIERHAVEMQGRLIIDRQRALDDDSGK